MNIEPGVVQGDLFNTLIVQPQALFGLITIAAGALIMGLCVVVLSRHKA